ncbi:MAG: DUF2683 family protein [Nanoarchaeota archaeon]|nr:DUF2683 family protein [Nanoarchaeota archaeon]
MVKAIIDITKETNQILNIIKARQSLNDKSAAINFIVEEYGADMMEPELRPEFIKKMLKQKGEKPTHVGTIEDFEKRYI